MIKIEDVSFSYGNRDADTLKKINLDISSGECVLLCGRSGCGKTTLLRLANGLVPYFYGGNLRGNIVSAGLDIKSSTSYDIAAKIGMVYQNPRSQFFNVDTDSELAFGIENLSYPREELKRRVHETVEELGLNNLLGRGIFELSGGEKQKIAFGSIVAMTPEVYLLDEPSANLDYHGTQLLKEKLRLIKKKGKTILITEHRLNYLQDLVDRIIYMDEGRIVETYSSDEFYSIDETLRIKMGLRSFQYHIEEKMEPMHTERGLTFRNVYSGYHGKAVLKDISFHANPGDIIGIVGSNGKGKSTLAETICGFNKCLQGSYYWHGQEVQAKDLLSMSYMVMQEVDYQLFADSAKNECRHGLKGIDENVIMETLEALNLERFSDHHPMTLSGGQKQRLAIAVGKICDKKIIIFDEPTSGLDYDGMIRVSKLLRELSSQGKILFVVTHDDELLNEVVDKMIDLDKAQCD